MVINYWLNVFKQGVLDRLHGFQVQYEYKYMNIHTWVFISEYSLMSFWGRILNKEKLFYLFKKWITKFFMFIISSLVGIHFLTNNRRNKCWIFYAITYCYQLNIVIKNSWLQYDLIKQYLLYWRSSGNRSGEVHAFKFRTSNQ